MTTKKIVPYSPGENTILLYRSKQNADISFKRLSVSNRLGRWGRTLDNNNYIGQYYKLNARIVHLYHPRLRYGNEDTKKLWLMNQNLFHERKGIIIRNKDTEWGKL